MNSCGSIWRGSGIWNRCFLWLFDWKSEYEVFISSRINGFIFSGRFFLKYAGIGLRAKSGTISSNGISLLLPEEEDRKRSVNDFVNSSQLQSDDLSSELVRLVFCKIEKYLISLFDWWHKSKRWRKASYKVFSNWCYQKAYLMPCGQKALDQWECIGGPTLDCIIWSLVDTH